MKTYLLDIIPSIKAYSKALDKKTFITNQYWLSYDTSVDNKVSFIFKKDNTLLISEEGSVEKGKWELVGNNRILMESPKLGSNLFVHEYLDDKFFILSQDSHKKAYYVFVNESKVNYEMISLQGVENYLNNLGKVNSSDKPSENKSSTDSDDKDMVAIIINVAAVILLLALLLILAITERRS